jgi:hypothetical protein
MDMIDINKSFESFKSLKKDIDNFINQNNNESDTRSKIIDNYLINILGWNECDIKREGHLDSGYFDYKISCSSISFIIEAKKTFVDFNLPSNHTKVKLDIIYGQNREVIEQIRNYCMDIGLQYGIITNGKQFIISKFFNTDGTSWKNNSCLIFNSVEDIENRFIEFYENTSKYSLINNRGFKYDFIKSNEYSKTILSTIISREEEINRNLLSSDLSPIIEEFFGEIFNSTQENDINFIKECFIENKEAKKNRDDIERLFADKAPSITNVIKIVNTNNIIDEISEEFKGDNISNKAPAPPKPIIIIGTKGAGKTTFINYLFRVREDKFSNDHLFIYIDFREFYQTEKDFEPNNMSKTIYEKLKDKYSTLELHSQKVLKRIYQKEIKQNDESIWGYAKENIEKYEELLSNFFIEKLKDSSKHLEFLNHYLIRERRKRIIVIIDNADQYDDTIQSKIFLYSHSLSRNSNCGIIFSLREGYYYKWRNNPPFDAFESNIYHITAPKYSEVLSKRIDYTLEHLNNIDIEKNTNSITEKGYKIEIPHQRVIAFLSGLKNSLFSEKNNDLIDFLSYTTYPNIRKGLEVFKQYLLSGHTNVGIYVLREISKPIEQNNTQIIPIHEFVKSLGLQNKLYYNSEYSIIKNIFIPPKECNDHFINYFILNKCYNELEIKGVANKFISYSTIINTFEELGYRKSDIQNSITILFEYELLESGTFISDTEFLKISEEVDICISSKGYYYFKELIRRFHYYDLILQDTPIFDEDLFSELKSVFPLSDNTGKRDLSDRLKSVNIFIKYLMDQENRYNNNSLIQIFGSPLQSIKTVLDGDIKKIESKII